GRMAVYYVEEGLDVGGAAKKIMKVLREKTSGQAGIILADSAGNVAIEFDTEHMPVAVSTNNSKEPYSSMKPIWPQLISQTLE
ncbi:MAG: isoaspartyl peptidase/L-asparaginase, partial [Candidatus Thorarchaeota archaeon]